MPGDFRITPSRSSRESRGGAGRVARLRRRGCDMRSRSSVPPLVLVGGRSSRRSIRASYDSRRQRHRRMRRSVTQVAWETRGGAHLYYTRSARRDGRVVREYIGCGRAGKRAASADFNRRVARQAARDASREAHRRIAEPDAYVTALWDAAETAAKAVLLVAGFHRHARGAWRRRRV